MMDWQPIETAPRWTPKPGQNIALGRPEMLLGWRGSDTIALGYWEPARDENGGWDQTGGGRWWSKNGPYADPTHWMPLPDPPQ